VPRCLWNDASGFARAPHPHGALRDSFIVDPHKWLYAPFDACALLYRDPALARDAHRQHASYLDSLYAGEGWNASDCAHHLTRRARGVPLWFSLATYGSDAHREAVETVLAVTRATAEEIRRRPTLELLMDPELSVVLFRRLGWAAEDYEAWWRRLLDAQVAFVQPTSWRTRGGAPVLREPAHHDRTRSADPRRDGLTMVASHGDDALRSLGVRYPTATRID
jgi:hypothetical protein